VRPTILRNSRETRSTGRHLDGRIPFRRQKAADFLGQPHACTINARPPIKTQLPATQRAKAHVARGRCPLPRRRKTRSTANWPRASRHGTGFWRLSGPDRSRHSPRDRRRSEREPVVAVARLRSWSTMTGPVKPRLLVSSGAARVFQPVIQATACRTEKSRHVVVSVRAAQGRRRGPRGCRLFGAAAPGRLALEQRVLLRNRPLRPENSGDRKP
jgi:hypothetical protein